LEGGEDAGEFDGGVGAVGWEVGVVGVGVAVGGCHGQGMEVSGLFFMGREVRLYLPDIMTFQRFVVNLCQLER
jgi:hypothetical protein